MSWCIGAGYAGRMKIVVIGAGVIGSVYAGRLAVAGHDVSVLARGSRKTTLERDGVRLQTVAHN